MIAGGWLTGLYRKGRDLPSSTRADRLPWRYDLSVPENQRKLEAAGQLGELAGKTGITMIEMAIAFVLRHPASARPSSARGPWSTWNPSSPRPAPCSATTCSTGSTRSSRPGPTSGQRTAAGTRRG